MKAALKIGLLAVVLHSIAAVVCFLIVALDPTEAADSEFGMATWTWLAMLDSPILLPAASVIRFAIPTFQSSNVKLLLLALSLGGAQWYLIVSALSLVIQRLLLSRRSPNETVA